MSGKFNWASFALDHSDLAVIKEAAALRGQPWRDYLARRLLDAAGLDAPERLTLDGAYSLLARDAGNPRLALLRVQGLTGQVARSCAVETAPDRRGLRSGRRRKRSWQP